MKAFAFAASFVALVVGEKPDYHTMWLKFKSDYNKNYDGNAEDERRHFNIFSQNVDIIQKHNSKKLSHWLGINEFADETADTFFSTHLGYNGQDNHFGSSSELPFPNITAEADSVDWVAKGAVTHVKNQAGCGSCWAFSTTGALEGAYFVASGKLVSLSESYLMECDSFLEYGCKGGTVDIAFKWIEQMGMCSEADYPYRSADGKTGTCKSCTPVVTITGITHVPSKNENALKAAVSRQPVSVKIAAGTDTFKFYKGGVLDDASCGTQLNHAVLVVGYGTDCHFSLLKKKLICVDYWKVKNSWGATWGENGYIRLVTNKNQCGIATAPEYPTAAKAAGSEIVV